MAGFRMEVSIRKLHNNPNMFEFVISTPTLTSQFRLPRPLVNKLRILIEKALVDKPRQ
ncbi:MAG: hypothetical protein JSV34_04080 [Candidatus Omnitrophota bacterium]|nr:MAG: hypothetical protein JSV34_04080 [Candidatus Omnitrophota bacterium]